MVAPVETQGAPLQGFRPIDITVDRESPTPLYHQIYAAIEEQINAGVLKPGERIQQERDLALSLGISLAPVRQAILSLVRHGYLQRSRGRGTFVRERAVEEELSILSSFSSLLEATGRPWSLDLLHSGVIDADDDVKRALGDVGRVLQIRRLAVLEVVGVTNDQHDLPIEYSRVLYHPARFRFRIDSRRSDESVVRLLAPPES